MKILSKLLLLTLAVGCGQAKELPEPKNEDKITDEQIQDLIELRHQTSIWAETCSEGIMCGSDGDGDSMLFASLLCASGETTQCESAKLSFDSDGAVRRSPGRLEQEVNASSRDMLLGALHYLVATKDTETAKRMLKSIQDNNNKLCPKATDNRCDLDPVQYAAMWGTMKQVWDYLGLEPSQHMYTGAVALESLLKIQAVYAEDGYPTHLVGVNLYLLQRVGYWTLETGKGARTISDRQPDNPFFEVIRRGKTKDAAAIVLKVCPEERPEPSHQWSWQRDTEEEAWEHSMGWDCIFIANVLLREGI